MATQTFTTTLEPRPRGGIVVALPFDPAEAWGVRDRYHVAGTIGGHSVRGEVEAVDGRPVMTLGPSWCRDPRVGGGTIAEVILGPEGPQVDDVPAELAERLRAAPAARRAFEALPTFYRNGFVRPIVEAKRAETRERRSDATIEALLAGRRTY
jgi:hypothetical protein